MTRYYELVGTTDDRPLPESDWLKVGAIIAVPRSNSPKPGAQWNGEISEWVMPIWRERTDPRKAADQ